MTDIGLASLMMPQFNIHTETWDMNVDRALCLGPANHKHMTGGACTAALIHAIEATTKRPIIQVSVQFIAAPATHADATISVQVIKSGRSISQCRAQMMSDGTIGVTMLATVGARTSPINQTWHAPPVAPLPDLCTRIPFVREDVGDLQTHLDMRLAAQPKDGQMVFWAKVEPGFEARGAEFLALIADYLPEAIHFNLGRRAGAVSLDNSLRVIDNNLSQWLLCQTHIQNVANGLFHGTISIFSQFGSLLALGSQSGVVQLFDD